MSSPQRSTSRWCLTTWATLVGCIVASSASTSAAEPAVTVLADFEDRAVAARIAEARNVLAGDCQIAVTSIPARGKSSLGIEIGATARDTSVACDFRFREVVRFDQVDRVALYCWIPDHPIEVSFRIRDARDQLFETTPEEVRLANRWVPVTARLNAADLRRVAGDGAPTYPLQVQGFRLTTNELGTQSIYIDDLHVEHRVPPRELVAGDFVFRGAGGSESARIFDVGADIDVAVVLENRSREHRLTMSVELAWIRPDGTTLRTQTGQVILPESGIDYRSHQSIDFSQVIDEPGLYRLVAQVRSLGWSAPIVFESSLAVTPTAGRQSRGTSIFFGMQSNLLREPTLDQALELRVARDIGVNLLAIETPWARIEPKPSDDEFGDLQRVVSTLTDRGDIAPLIVLTDPPDWLHDESDHRVTRLGRLIRALAARFDQRVAHIQLSAAVLPGDVAAQLEATEAVRATLGDAQSALSLYPPAIRVDTAAPRAVATWIESHPGSPIMFETRGTTNAALESAAAFREAGGFDWETAHLWRHVSEPIIGTGAAYHAEAVLAHYLQAASAGVGGVIWSDLRDDDNDASQPDRMRGLVRRDFSPKTSLLGYAAVAGRLTGYRHVGPVPHALREGETALFLGDRQIAVVRPLPNRILPAVLAWDIGVPGTIEVRGFQRGALPVLSSRAAPLVPLPTYPLFLTLTTNAPESDPQIRLMEPWLRVPRTVLCDDTVDFTITVEAPFELRRSYLQLRLPDNAPIETSLSAMRITGATGEPISQDVELRRKAGARDFDRVDAVLRVALEGDTLEVPIIVRPLVSLVRRGRDEAIADDAYRLGELRAAEGAGATAECTVHAGYARETIDIVVRVKDDQFVPPPVPPISGIVGDQLLFGLALEDATQHAEVQVRAGAAAPMLAPLYDTPESLLRGWRCELTEASDDTRLYTIRVPYDALDVRRLRIGARLLMAVCYVDDDANGFPPVRLRWGHGLDGTRSTAEFRWIEVGGRR